MDEFRVMFTTSRMFTSLLEFITINCKEKRQGLTREHLCTRSNVLSLWLKLCPCLIGNNSTSWWHTKILEAIWVEVVMHTTCYYMSHCSAEAGSSSWQWVAFSWYFSWVWVCHNYWQTLNPFLSIFSTFRFQDEGLITCEDLECLRNIASTTANFDTTDLIYLYRRHILVIFLKEEENSMQSTSCQIYTLYTVWRIMYLLIPCRRDVHQKEWSSVCANVEISSNDPFFLWAVPRWQADYPVGNPLLAQDGYTGSSPTVHLCIRTHRRTHYASIHEGGHLGPVN